MKMFVIGCVLMVVVLCALSAAAFGGVPRMLTFQGKLTDSVGQPVPDGVQSVTFRLYDVETGGTALWQEVQNVQTNGGIFNVNLGAVTPITLPFDRQYWLSMQPPNCGELSPRTRLTTAPYAVRADFAGTAESVADGAITGPKIADSAVGTAKIAPGAVTADRLAPGVAIPPGAVLMWSGPVASIPTGWALCDGTNGTPDLRDRFVVGAGGSYAVGATGGTAQVTLTVDQMPTHNHGVNDPGHRHGVPGVYNGADATGGTWDAKRPPSYTVMDTFTSTTGITIQNTGIGQAHENRPPYYALCFIVKLAY